MNFPPPSAKQAQVIWFSVTTLAVAVVLSALGATFWALGSLINALASLIVPLAVAGIIACLLDPVVDFFQQRMNIPRVRAILLVFFIGMAIVVLMLGTVVPELVVQTNKLAANLPDYSAKFREQFSHWLKDSMLGQRAQEAWDQDIGLKVQQALKDTVPFIKDWLIAHLGSFAVFMSYAVGLALVPVYLFYFLLEKSGIQSNWSDYLPIRESTAKQELVFVLSAINDCIVVFFRGQILVSLCSGTLLGLGLLLCGIDYAVLLGALAAVLCILPYIGSIITFVLAMVLAAVQYGDGRHFIQVAGVFLFVQLAEGLVYSPRILGNRVGLHPLTIIICVMIGTKLLGGILGGLLAIPITAALRTIMFRYVWRKPAEAEKVISS
ncbi:MAG: AI-2E family transporter [Proteobacteria bacterium]|nr:AI-2E family transporter [Pseudomonadota bacterium]